MAQKWLLLSLHGPFFDRMIHPMRWECPHLMLHQEQLHTEVLWVLQLVVFTSQLIQSQTWSDNSTIASLTSCHIELHNQGSCTVSFNLSLCFNRDTIFLQDSGNECNNLKSSVIHSGVGTLPQQLQRLCPVSASVPENRQSQMYSCKS